MSLYTLVDQRIDLCSTGSKPKGVLTEAATSLLRAASPITLNLVAGAVFGAALLSAGVHHPSVIISQLRLNDFHMLKVFLGASACSVLVVFAAQNLEYLPNADSKKPSFCGWLGANYGNVLAGGLMVGVGMGITGACPGTAFVQMGAGISSGYFVVLGGLVGAGLFTVVAPSIREAQSRASARSSAPPARTIPEKFAIDKKIIIVAYELACLAFIAMPLLSRPVEGMPRLAHPIYGGLLLGVAQAVSVFLRSKTIGVSVAYEDAAKVALGRTQGRRSFWAELTPAVQFVVGMFLGSAALASSLPTQPAPYHVSAGVAVLGGLVMVFGARLAGGCPSGHGISGMANFSIASTLAVAAMFGGGICTALLVSKVAG